MEVVAHETGQLEFFGEDAKKADGPDSLFATGAATSVGLPRGRVFAPTSISFSQGFPVDNPLSLRRAKISRAGFGGVRASAPFRDCAGSKSDPASPRAMGKPGRICGACIRAPSRHPL